MKLYPISMVGGILGIVSLALPWLTISYPLLPGMSVTVSGSGFEMFSLTSLLGMMGSLGSVGSSISGAILLMTLGVILALIGSIVSFLHFAGGPVTLAGGVCGLAGALWLGSVFSSLGAGLLGFAFGPGFGLYLTIGAGIVAIAGFAKPIPLAGITGQPRYGYPAYPPYPGAPPGPAYPGYAPYATQYPGYGTPPPPTPDSTAPATPPLEAPAAPPEAWAPAAVPEEVPPAAAAVLPEEPLRTCPTCGRQVAALFCPEDGTPLNPPPSNP